MVLIDSSVSKLRGGPKRTQVERAPDNNKAKYLQGGKKQNRGNEEFILSNPKDTGIAFSGDNFAWLGNQFREGNDQKLPSLQQVFDGLTLTMRDILLEQCKVKDEEKKKKLFELSTKAFATIKKLIKQKKCSHTEPLTKEILSDPDHIVVKTLLYIYSLEPPIYRYLNKASREKDQRYVETLGPFSDCLRTILHHAEKNRQNKIPFGRAFKVYRGLGLKEEHIKEYRDMEGNKNGINLRGFTSTSQDKKVSLDFALKGASKDGVWKSVLIQLEVKNKKGYEGFQMNSPEYTAYPHEKEILFYDGIQAKVKKISELKEGDKKYILIDLLKEF